MKLKMIKTKKNYVKLPKKKELERISEPEDNYDSMVENGTSEDDSTTNESDDEFSAKEEDFIMKKPQEKTEKRKSKLETPSVLKKPRFGDENSKFYKAPTVEEINQLKETENLFHSNLFRMQIDEMLKEIKVKEKYNLKIQEFLSEFNKFLDSLTSQQEKEEFSPNLKWLKKSKLRIPINTNDFKPSKFLFQFLKPEKPAVMIGSQSAGTLIGPELICDVYVSMPSKCFQKGDYLNLIYDQKRALYLVYLVHQIQVRNLNFGELRFSQFRGNPYKPVLEITPSTRKIKFRIFVSPDQDSFKLNRFVPWNSNIRESVFIGSKCDAEEEIFYATPNYNANVLFDLTMAANQKLIEEGILLNRNMREGLILLKIWLRQRNLDQGFAGFSNFIMAIFAISLFKDRKLHASMSSYQVARNIWNHLAASNWNEDGKGLSLCTTNEPAPNQPTLEQMHANYDVVLIDSSGFLNICSNLSLDNYLRIKFEAARAVELLNNHKINSFQQLFMIDYPIYTQYDHIFGINDETEVVKVLKKFGKVTDRVNYGGFWYPQVLKMITSVIRKGLGNRILALSTIEKNTPSWDCSNELGNIKIHLQIGLILNHDNAFEILEKGPQANDEKKAKEFRDFWGSKSELRRFQDGSITEACVWSNANECLTQKRLIVKNIITHLLKYHFNIDQINYLASEFDLAYQLDKIFYVFEDGNNDAENTALEVIKSFDDLGKKLRSLNDLPLDITSIQGVSSVFRYCQPIPILAQARTYKDSDKCVFQAYKINDGLIQMGASGKWPNDLKAFRRIKTAFHIKIARSLAEKYKLNSQGGIDGVHVLKDGFVFRIEIAHQKEIGLLKKEINSKGIITFNDTPESVELEKRIIILPKVTSALHGLYQTCPTYGPTVMIAKRWLYSQLFDNFLWPDECTELLIASQFLKMNSFVNPCQPQTGFLRFLKLLASADWKNEMFLLNFNDEMPSQEIAELENKFITERDSFPSLFIVTSFDQKKYRTRSSPSIQILARASMLARLALSVLEPCYNFEKTLNVSDLFIASLDGYDVLIKLRNNLVQTCHAHNFHSISRAGHKIDATIPAAGFNPVEKAIQELRDGYSEFALFFNNPCGGKEIAVIWKPEIFQIKDFKLADINGCEPSGTDKLKYNLSAFIEDFKIILKGLYHSIEVQKINP